MRDRLSSDMTSQPRQRKVFVTPRPKSGNGWNKSQVYHPGEAGTNDEGVPEGPLRKRQHTNERSYRRADRAGRCSFSFQS